MFFLCSRLLAQSGNFPETKKLAEDGKAAAQFSIGFMYQHGEGVEQDKTAAAMWYRKAADQGYSAAQYVLGLMYMSGNGVPKDDVEAYAWLNLAAISHDEARKYRDSLDQALTNQVQFLGQQRTKQLQQEIEKREIDRLMKEDRERRENVLKGT